MAVFRLVRSACERDGCSKSIVDEGKTAMALRWTAAGMLEAEKQFRRIIGYSALAKLAVAVERDIARARADDAARSQSSMPTEEAATLATV